MPMTFHAMMAFRCARCFALYGVPEPSAMYGSTKEVDLLLANPCAACGKGSVEHIGHFWFEPTAQAVTPEQEVEEEYLRDPSTGHCPD
jgi:hypothetical protein